MKFIFTFLLASVTSILYSQNAKAFPTNNTSWCYGRYGDHGETFGSLCITVNTKKTINGLEYSQGIYEILPFYGDTAYYRVDGNQVYVLPQDSTNEFLLYDFNLKVGDTFKPNNWGFGGTGNIELTVTSIDSIFTNDMLWRKYFNLYDNLTGRSTAWIEGIGDTDWPFLYPSYFGSVSGGFLFGCHEQNGRLIYPNESTSTSCINSTHEQNDATFNLRMSPNPVYDFLYIDLEPCNSCELIVIDGNGRKTISNKFFTGNTIDVSDFTSGLYTIILTHNLKTYKNIFVKM